MADQVPDLDPMAAAALAAIILERLADALSDDPTLMQSAITELAAETALALDVCAGILLACSTVAGAGSVPPVAIAAAAMQLEASTVETFSQ